jgi:hypothetical protein
MASKEIQETGETTTAKEEDTVTSLPETVIICEACMRGYTRWIPGGIDAQPLWEMWDGASEGYICGGPLTMISRSKAILGATKWLEEQQKK